jgi:hypothetical protein
MCGRLLQQPIRDQDQRVVHSEMPFYTLLLYCTVICLFVARLLASILVRPNVLSLETFVFTVVCFYLPPPFDLNI